MLREEINYRIATPADARDLAGFGSESFIAAYGHALRPGDLALHVTRTYSEERQLQELIDPRAWTVLAEREAEIVGAALLRWSSPPAGLAAELRWTELARFYVARSYWRTGTSTDLMIATLKSIRDREGLLVWLQVWEAALHAISFYRKWGFYEVGEAPFRVGTLVQRDLVLARSLRHGSPGL
ncbi:MAG TPA: GNAT family N-acetyltransferase [Gemmatimonadales bacterium]|jgi:GNAT superfamily N-acetyltransferase|nr:GNAT family N-acetyltransferase [Gemmatimonadales bacterium]